jgi:hypothetical protein
MNGKESLLEVLAHLPGYPHSPELTAELLDGWAQVFLGDLNARKLIHSLRKYQTTGDPAYWDHALAVLAEVLAAEQAARDELKD